MANNDKLQKFYDHLSIEELCRMYEAVNRQADEIALEIVQKRAEQCADHTS